MLVLKFMTSQPREQTIAMYILPNISRGKGNQTTKFGQIIQINLRNVFLEKLSTECGGTLLRLCPKKSKFSMPLDQ